LVPFNNIVSGAFPVDGDENQIIGEAYQALGKKELAKLFLDRYHKKTEN